MKTQNNKSVNPERLSGHNLVKYLIDNPNASGKFKWHTLRSCMWRNLLLKCPEYAKYGTPDDFQKITHCDALKIVKTHGKLMQFFPQDKFSDYDWLGMILAQPDILPFSPKEKFSNYVWRVLLQTHPTIADNCPLEKLSDGDWSEVLIRQNQLADRCPFEKFSGWAWANLLAGASVFADKCNWEPLDASDWQHLLLKKKTFLANCKLEYIKSAKDWQMILEKCYFGDVLPYGGLFVEEISDAATYLINKSMDKDNAKRFLKNQYANKNWAFIEELCDISPDEAIAVDGKKYMPFYLALTAPDSLFYKFFQSVNTKLRDTAGNTVLFPALIRDLVGGSTRKHYQYILEHGLDPDEKNLAGFSCNDLIKYFNNMKGKK